MTREITFEVITKKTSGTVIVKKHSQYNNLDADILVIEKNITVRVFGRIKTLLVLEKGSCLYMHGEISGNVENNGGKLQLFAV